MIIGNDSKYSLHCHFCLCEVCTRRRCPYYHRRTRWDFCLAMIQAENCPILKCDFFSHKEIHLGWRVKRKESQSRKKTAMQKLDEILAKLDRMC